MYLMAHPYDDPGSSYTVSFAPTHVQAAATALGMYAAEEFEVVVRCLHEEHVFRVVHVREAMAAYPPESVPDRSIPHAVRHAIAAMEAVVDLIDTLAIPRLEPDVLFARVAEKEGAA